MPVTHHCVCVCERHIGVLGSQNLYTSMTGLEAVTALNECTVRMGQPVSQNDKAEAETFGRHAVWDLKSTSST